MSYNGSGTFLINSTGQPVVAGTVISSSVFNALTTDIANGLSTAITKDGQTTVTANIPLNGYKVTNLGAATVATDAAQLDQVQSGTATLLTVTGTDTYVGTASPSLSAYAAGNVFTFVVPNTNTGPATLNVSSLGAKTISRDGSTALVAGDLVAGSEVVVAYDGTRFQVLNSNSKTNFNVSNNLKAASATLTTPLAVASGGSGISSLTTNGVLYASSGTTMASGSTFVFDGTNVGIGVSPVAANGIFQLGSYGAVQALMEKITVSATAATGTINLDAVTQGVLYYTSNATANWTLNVRGNSTTTLNSIMQTGQSITVVFMATNGSTPYYQSAMTIDGASVTPKWLNNLNPTVGNASSVDVYSYVIVKTGNAAFTVFATQSQFK
jgi:hypothetical protein